METSRANGLDNQAALNNQEQAQPTFSLVVFAGQDAGAICAQIQNVLAASEQKTLQQISAESINQLQAGAVRLALVASDKEQLLLRLPRILNEYSETGVLKRTVRSGAYYSEQAVSGKTAVLFPGFGSQYPGMLSQLEGKYAEVDKWLSFLDRVYQGRAADVPSTLLASTSEEQLEAATVKLLQSTSGLGILLSTSMALYQTLQRYGLKADYFAGHSNGELTAQVASGIFGEIEEQKLQSLLRGLQEVTFEFEVTGRAKNGVVLAVSGISKEEIEGIILRSGEDVHLALVNCPNQSILYGDKLGSEKVAAQLRAAGAICQALPFGHVYHSKAFREISEEFGRVYQRSKLTAAHTPLVTSTDGSAYPTAEREIIKFATRQWQNQVDFPRTIRRLYERGVRIFVDAGPGNSLAAFVSDILAEESDVLVVSANSQMRGAEEQLFHALGSMFVHGFNPTLDSATVPVSEPTTKVDFAPQEYVPGQHFYIEQPTVEQQRACLTTRQSWPLLGKVLQHREDFLEIERTFDQSKDLYLRDHTLSKSISAVNPDAVSLPIVPFTVTAEMICEAAAYLLADQYTVREMRDLRGHRWLSLDNGTLTVRAEARLLPSKVDGEKLVAVKVFEVTDSKERELASPVLFEGTVVLGTGYAAAPSPHEFDFTDAKPATFPDMPIYHSVVPPKSRDLTERCMGLFHGPAFQGLQKLTRANLKCLEFSQKVLSTNEFFSDIENPRFQFDPCLTDVLGHPIGHVTIEGIGRGFALFPFSVDSIERFTEFPPAGTELFCRQQFHFAKITDPTQPIDVVHETYDVDGNVIRTRKMGTGIEEANPEKTNHGNFNPENIFLEVQMDLVDADENLYVRIKGWRDRPMSLPLRYGLARQYPIYEYLSEGLNGKHDEGVTRWIKPQFNIPADVLGGIWFRTLAYNVLNDAEREVFRTFQGPRQEEWLLGRIAAKDALRRWIFANLGVQLSPYDVEIQNLASGKPVAYCRALSSVQLPDVSITHTAGHALATCGSTLDHKVGIDALLLEDATRLSQISDLVTAAFTDQEQRLAEEVPDIAPDELMYMLWCAKEAAAKASGKGLSGGPKEWVVGSISVRDEGLVVSISHAGQFYRSVVARHSQMLVATSTFTDSGYH